MIFYFIILLIMEIIFIILGRNEKKYHKIFKGIFLGYFASVFLYCLYVGTEIFSYDTGAWKSLGEYLKSIFLVLANCFVGIIGLIMGKKYKNVNTNNKKLITLKSFFVVVFLSFITIFCQYLFRNNTKVTIEDEIKKETLSYLKNKYGSDNFVIESIDRHYSANGFIGTDHLDNYDIYAVYTPDNSRFYIYLDVDNSRKILKDTFDDRLISTYYSEKYFKNDDFEKDIYSEKEKLNTYLKEKGLNVELSLYSRYIVGLDNDKAVPKNYGKIPSKEELYELILNYSIKHKFEININESEIDSNDLKTGMKSYLINLSTYLSEYYSDLDDYKIECRYRASDGSFFNGSMTINEKYITIKGNLLDEKIER